MTNSGSSNHETDPVVVLQIIQAALAFGVLSFAAVTLAVVRPPTQGNTELPPVALALMGAAIVTASMRFVVPRVIAGQGLRQIAEGTWRTPDGTPEPSTDEGRLAAVHRTQTIVGSALLEGSAFTALFGYLTSGSIWLLIVPLLALCGLMFDFPTAGKVAAWCDTQAKAVRELRQLAGRVDR